MNNKIKFYPSTEYVKNIYDAPSPAVKLLPTWWKNMPKYSNAEASLKFAPAASITAKQCSPLLDAMGAGYYLTLPCDIIVKQEDGFPVITWATDEPLFSTWHKDQVSTYDIPDNFSSTVFKFLHGWIFETPPGWSTLFLQPLAYLSSETLALPGLVDTDILKTDINCPLVIKKGFEGIIEKGTPLVQLIPFKRNNWKSEVAEVLGESLYFEQQKLRTKAYQYYSRLRDKKRYI